MSSRRNILLIVFGLGTLISFGIPMFVMSHPIHRDTPVAPTTYVPGQFYETSIKFYYVKSPNGYDVRSINGMRRLENVQVKLEAQTALGTITRDNLDFKTAGDDYSWGKIRVNTRGDYYRVPEPVYFSVKLPEGDQWRGAEASLTVTAILVYPYGSSTPGPTRAYEEIRVPISDKFSFKIATHEEEKYAAQCKAMWQEEHERWLNAFDKWDKNKSICYTAGGVSAFALFLTLMWRKKRRVVVSPHQSKEEHDTAGVTPPVFSHHIMIPAQADATTRAQSASVPDWRGIPLATPCHFYKFPPNQRVRIVKHWREGGDFFLKLVEPYLCHTVDYAIRYLFHPLEKGTPVTNRLMALLEIAPGYPEDEIISKLTVVEVLRSDLIRTLEEKELQSLQPIVEDIIQHRLEPSLEVIEAAFGQMSSWKNPAHGEPGNIHAVCHQCSNPVDKEWLCAECMDAKQQLPNMPIKCPTCHRDSYGIKRFTLPNLIIFILVAAHIQRTTYTACQSCMRGIITKRALINIIPANLIWPILFIIYAIQFMRTFFKGHSKSVLNDIDSEKYRRTFF